MQFCGFLWYSTEIPFTFNTKMTKVRGLLPLPNPLIAETYFGRADAGRSRPPICLASDGTNSFEVYLKFPGLHANLTPSKLTSEWMAARLAGALELPAAKPHQVLLNSQFIAALPEELRVVLGGDDCLAYGAEGLGDQWHVWGLGSAMPRRKKLDSLAIYIFDTTIQNWDRSIGNPNLLKRGDDVAILDHEEAFQPWVTGDEEEQPRRYPWEPNGIDNYWNGDAQHVLWRGFSSAHAKLVEEALLPWKKLSKADFAVYAGEIPSQWDQAAGQRIAAFLGLALDNIDDLESQVKELLKNA